VEGALYREVVTLRTRRDVHPGLGPGHRHAHGHSGHIETYFRDIGAAPDEQARQEVRRYGIQ